MTAPHSNREKHNRILLVEDNDYNRELMQDYLQTCFGIRVTVAADGRQALAALAIDQPDLLLLDLKLPDMDGFAVLQELTQRSMQIPVFVISACTQPADKERAMHLGAMRYFVKPTCLAELCRAIEAVLQQSTSCRVRNTCDCDISEMSAAEMQRLI